MQPDSYDSMAKALAKVGLVAQKRNENQLVVSCQEGAVQPNRGNSFWLSRREGAWYLSTWLPSGYQVPADRDIVALCSACMGGTSAMYRVPAALVMQFQLRELGEDEYERLFGGG